MNIRDLLKKGPKANLDHLERRDWELLAMAVLMILALTFYILISHIWEMADSPREWFRDVTSVKTYLTGFSFLIILFCIYIVAKNMELRKLRRQLFAQKVELEKMASTLAEITAFYQISSEILRKEKLETIFESILKETLKSLKADRVTIYMLDKETKILRTQISHAPNPLHEKVNLWEEREMARRTILQDSPFLLNKPEDFQGFFNYAAREDKITSLLSYPFHLHGQPWGVLTLVRINRTNPFNEDDLKILSVFGQYASLAVENAKLWSEIKKKATFPKKSEQYSQQIFELLCELPEEDKKKVDDYIRTLLLGQRKEKGKVVLLSELAPERRQEERINEIIQVEFDDHILAQTVNISGGGVFIRTNDPLDLEEEFYLKLHIPDGGMPAEVVCKVVWTNKYGKERDDLPRGMGVKFIKINPQDKKRIEDFIQMQKIRKQKD